MVQLYDFGANPCSSSVGHDQVIELKHHAGATLDFAGHVDLRNVTVNSDVSVPALVNSMFCDLGLTTCVDPFE